MEGTGQSEPFPLIQGDVEQEFGFFLSAAHRSLVNCGWAARPAVLAEVSWMAFQTGITRDSNSFKE